MFSGGTERNEPKALDTQNIKELVQEYTSRTKTAESASITSKELIVTEGDAKSLTYVLPENEFFVSIAPYVDKTHPCATHSLTGCQGEMVEEEFNVNIVDTEGNEVMDKTMKSQSNGFIDLWLPRDKTYHITVEHDGKTAESDISTFESDDTCISTMQLMEKKSI
ncbi:CueP family metal-binding protein [Paenibacillus wynnii]|uniref:CueP family metal-binding protein n=1 Tax=Paenibacillus wynnii TaxID=268407 RepID=UPI0027D8E897|nr:CueP family metal-binding protein [Paenibacillus wynnii]